MKLWAWPRFPQNWQCSTVLSRCADPARERHVINRCVKTRYLLLRLPWLSVLPSASDSLERIACFVASGVASSNASGNASDNSSGNASGNASGNMSGSATGNAALPLVPFTSSGHALGSQGPPADWSELSDSSPDWPRSPASALAGRRDLPRAVRAGRRRGGGFSVGGVRKGEEGGDWEERLDSAGRSRDRNQ
ncbi:hypothetical protein EYF80_062621 [Liparis tanakae]|uniref:Uncharacterized protein n=1 Tax=Liparis tanakae TaxID=230148 RepID=A0A4Z2EEP7_9TELE|nr:hypothetical protein EYF80_062621 [Liparis tanakae]